METPSPPHPAIDLSTHQLVHTSTDPLPPPLDHTQEALRTRNQAITKVAALPPVNANKADLKREPINGTATKDAQTLHMAERSMLRVVDLNAGPLEVTWPVAASVKAPAACVDQGTKCNVS